MKPETLVKLSVALLSEAEQEFRYKANECLAEFVNINTTPKIKSGVDAKYDRLMGKADAILEVIDKLNKI
jgi:hypothetical protein